MGRPGAIWVNLVEQAELPGQIENIKNNMEAWGYTVDPEHVLTIDPNDQAAKGESAFVKLTDWINSGTIRAVGILDREQLQVLPDQRAKLIEDGSRVGLQWIVCEGEAMETATTGADGSTSC